MEVWGSKNEALEGMYHFDKEQDPHQSEKRDTDPHKNLIRNPAFITCRVKLAPRNTVQALSVLDAVHL